MSYAPSMTKYIVRWIGWMPDGYRDLTYISFRKGLVRWCLPKEEARQFDSREAAINFIKVYIRNGRFGSQDWTKYIEIETIEVSETPSVP